MSEFPEDCPLPQSPLDLTQDQTLTQDCLLVQASLTGHLFCLQLLPSPVIMDLKSTRWTLPMAFSSSLLSPFLSHLQSHKGVEQLLWIFTAQLSEP